ncbi:MAG: hypothetical protein ACRDH7_12835, partial [Actinomycetota bacterium]
MAADEEAVKQSGFIVSIETWGDGVETIDSDALTDLAPMIGELGGMSAAASAGGLAGGPGATFTIYPDSMYPAVAPHLVIGPVVSRGVEIFTNACEKVGVAFDGIAHVDAMEES